MSTYYIKESIKILRKEGAIELSRRIVEFLYDTIMSKIHYNKRYLKYDAPPRQNYSIPPAIIKYDISGRVSKHYNWQTRYPPFLVLDGDWDKLKTKFENKWVYKSYIQRYKENKPWEETKYYTHYRNKGYSHNAAMEELNTYDEIFEDIKSNGYNENKPIKVYLGRNGEYMRATGQNRLCMAKILGLNSIPVQVELVHKQWQALRENIYNNGLSEEHENLRDHPDLQDILN